MARGELQPAHHWQLVAGCGIGILTLGFLMMLVILSVLGNEVPVSARFLVVSVLSLGLALASGFLGAHATASGNLPLPLAQSSPLKFGVGGGVAVFVIGQFIGANLYPAEPDPNGTFSDRQPVPTAPAAGAIFDHVPRNVQFSWTPLDDADHYKVEIQIFTDTQGWISSPRWSGIVTPSPHHDLVEFGGANAGRWRIRAVSVAGIESRWSDWRMFNFTK